jgi:hypothetical protein
MALAFFNAAYYLTQNPDVAARWVGTPEAHYTAFGAAEMRAPAVWFDYDYYRANNADLQSMTALQLFTHYNTFGYKEARVTAANYVNFDAAKYLADYSDLGAGGITASTAAWHYMYYGANEQRVAYNTSGSVITGGGNVGTTYTLTTGVDNFTGTVSNDTFNSSVDLTAANTVGATSTLNAADQINGAAGVDTLNITYSGAFANNTGIPAAGISNVEIINVRNVTSNALTGVDLSLIPGVTAFNSDRSNGAVTVTNVGKTASLGVIGNGTVVNGALTAKYVAGTTAATLNVSGGTATGAGAVTINGDVDALLKTLTVNSTGAANTLGGIATPAAVTAVNINASANLITGGITGVAAGTTITVAGGATSVNLGALAANVTTVTASGLTAGGITATIGALAQVITGGTGNDTITTAGVQTGAVNAGAGTADKLIVAAVADVAATPAAKFTNFEILQNNAAGSIDASLVAGITSVVLNNAGAGSFTNLSATQAAAVSVIQSNTGGTLALKDATGLTDVVNITGTTTVVATAVDVKNLSILGVETLNYTNSATAASTLSLAGAAAASAGLKTITVAGTKGVTLDVAAAATPAHATTLTLIDASLLTAQATGTNTFTLLDTVGGHALKAGLTVTGSGGDDVVTFATTDTIATGLVTVNGGAGNDAFSATLAQLFTTGQGAISFNGGTDGSATVADTLTISDAAAGTVVDSTFMNLSNVENLAFTNTGAISLTTGGFFNTAFTAGGVKITDGATLANAVTFDLTSFTGASSITNVGTTGVQTITGGTGIDKITITSAVAATGASTVVLKGGAGADVIKITDASVMSVSHSFDITGGVGADSITSAVSSTLGAASNIFFNVNVGDSLVGASDIITGFNVVAAGSRLADTIDFTGAAIKPATAIAATAVTGYALAALNFTVSTAGQLVFGGTSASTVTAAQVETVWSSQIAVLLNNLETVVWADANASDAQNGNSLVFNHNTLGDSEVILVGVQATAVGAAAATANLVGIA